MGKPRNSKKKTNKKSQPPTFTKVKKKVGKRQLPANTTRIDFKSRQIHLPSQLANEGTTSRISTYIQQLKHHNVNTRVRAINSIQQIATKESEFFKNVLANVLYGIGPIFTDVNVEVQKEFRNFLAVLFTLFPADNFTPYFSLIIAYLIASLTHTDVNIKTTALNMGRSLVTLFPNETSHHVHVILPKYLSLLTGYNPHNLRSRKTPTFSQLVAPRISTNLLAVNNTLEQSMLIFENIKITSALLVPHAKSHTSSNTNSTPSNKYIVHIPPRLFHTSKQSIEIHESIVGFFTTFLSVSWSDLKELHSSLSNSSLSTNKIEHIVNTISTIIDTYMLIPCILTIDVLDQIECSLTKEYSSNEESWITELYSFFSCNFPIEIAGSCSIASLRLNYQILNLYISVHIFSNPDKPFSKQEVTEFIDNLELTSDDVIKLISILVMLQFCKQKESTCDCPHIIQLICDKIWNYLHQNCGKEEILEFLIFLLDYYFELTDNYLLVHLNNILNEFSSMVQQCKLTESLTDKMVYSLSRMFARSHVPLAIVSSRNDIIISLLTSITQSEYSELLQSRIIHLAFFSNINDSDFLNTLLNDVITRLSIDNSLCLLDVLFISYKTHIRISANFSKFLRGIVQAHAEQIPPQAGTAFTQRVNRYIEQL
ncbi:Testis-expressed sequence 10 protein-like [Oopsacas minuta]|uniref:Testis-expressed sequence 10 protein-like n=1 Tax=Oopsacas minuta TaxID=111878 RepID=A0AAV7JXI8_9METZ|nr:Testis-expressed sequence 10 protein-like [Oopsacas minuta]